MKRSILLILSCLLFSACDDGKTTTTGGGDTGETGGDTAADSTTAEDSTASTTDASATSEDTTSEDTGVEETSEDTTTEEDTAPDATTEDTTPDVEDVRQDAAPVCQFPPNVAQDVVLGEDFQNFYFAFDLGPVPGVPDPLGGCTISWQDENTLLIVGGSESPSSAIYAIEVERGPCGHIIGFVGEAEVVAQTPYADANLVYAENGVLLYTQWPQYMFSQLELGATAPARDLDLTTLGMATDGDSGPGGVGRLPESMRTSGREYDMRMVTWTAGRWFQVEVEPDGDLWQITNLTETVLLPNNPGGFAYVPASSPRFSEQSIIVSEWVSGDPTQDRVAVYEVDANGDPIIDTRREFFTTFSRPWGAYFDPPTGDFLFLQWGGSNPPDRVFIVQGFEPLN